MNESETKGANESATCARVPQDSEASQGGAKANKGATSYPKAQMTSKTYFQDMHQFLINCIDDKRLTPKTQLVYRTLVALYNRAYWTANFVVTDSELMTITHIKSKDDLNGIKSKLKDMGYISYFGRPSKYTIYSPADQKPDREADHRSAPRPPRVTIKQSNKTIKERKKRKKGSEGDDVQHSNADRGSAKGATDSALVAELKRQIAEL